MATEQDSPLKKRFFNSFEYFADISSAHGIRYVLHPNFPVKERFFWVVMVLIHAVLASYVGFNLWLKFADAPIHNVIANIHYPLANLIFPAVTLCPANRINRTRGVEILSRYLNVTEENHTVVLNPILNALTVMKYPSYFNMERHLEESENHWNLFETLDLRDFFLQTLPNCEELFEECYWEGTEMECCELFSLQRTEEGFCYAFNSLTIKDDCKCPFGEEDDFELKNPNSSCSYFHTSSTGSFSGLTVIMKREGPTGEPVDENSIIRGVMVLINSACEYPEAGSGALFETFPGHILEVEVTPVVFEADSTIKSLSREDRMCLFPGERCIPFYHHYSEHNCLIECRHKFITDSCKCQPPIFSDPTLPYASCSLPELMCISNLSSLGKIKNATGGYCMEGQESGCMCWPSCHRLKYELRTRSNILTIFKGKEREGILEIHYSNLGAIKYQTQLTFTVEELLIAIGGTGSILMGASMISGAEFLYYTVRGIYRSITKIGRKYRTKNIPPSASFAN